MRSVRFLIVLGLVATVFGAFFVVSSSAVKPDKPNRPEKPAKPAKPKKPVVYIFAGNYEGDSAMSVKRGNAWVRKGGLIGQTVVFDLSSAKILVADTNSSGAADLADVQVGDWVKVVARLARKSPEQPFAALRLLDKTNPPELCPEGQAPDPETGVCV